jgi:acetyl esterase
MEASLVKFLFRLPDPVLKLFTRGKTITVGGRTMTPGTQILLHILEQRRPTKDLANADPKKLRDLYDKMAGSLDRKPAPLKTKDHELDVDQGTIPVREYIPDNIEDRGNALIYFHGGGMVLCSIKTHDILCRHLANQLGWKVFSIGYRLAPEHQYPVPLNDCESAFDWIADNADDFNIDSGKLAVGGDSAGGNLAASLCVRRKEESKSMPSKQLLIYPATDWAGSYQSRKDYAEGFFLTLDLMKWFTNHYLVDDKDSKNIYVSPIRYNNPAGLPDAVVVTAGFDPLRDEGIAYAKHLRDAGVKVIEREHEGTIHAFANFTIEPLAYRAVLQMAQDLKTIAEQ